MPDETKPPSVRPARPDPAEVTPAAAAPAPAAEPAASTPAAAEPAPPQPASPEPARPTPVRAAMGPDHDGSPPESAQPSAVVEVDGVEWTATVLGRARGGPAATPTPLILIGFTREGDDAVSLETLLAADRLEGLSELALRDALASAAPPPDPDGPTATFFPGASERRNRGG